MLSAILLGIDGVAFLTALSLHVQTNEILYTIQHYLITYRQIPHSTINE